jgi:glycosyltransferase A (GT-A) superfamily protein (DUF2064 family)
MKRALLLFTKVPQPGRVKTRLIGAHGLSAEAASEVYSAILKDIFEIMKKLTQSIEVQMYVAYAPQAEGPVIRNLLCGTESVNVSFFPQTEGAATAQRIALAFDKAFDDGNQIAVMIFGDQPELNETLLLEAYRTLESAVQIGERHLVLGPTCDGGTYLIGLTSNLLSWLHSSIDCTYTSKAVSKLVVKARAADLPVTLLDERIDLDDLYDLELLKDQRRGNYPSTNSVLKTIPSTSSPRTGDMITVIIPTLDEEKTLERTIMPIRRQPCPCEIIVADGGSSDRTLELANRLADRVIVTSRRGRQHQENVAANGAKGDVLLFLHADTVVPPTLLQSIVTSLHDQTIVAGGAHLIYSPPERLRYKALSALRDVGSRLLRISGMGSAFFIRRDTFQLLGGFDEEMNEEAVDMCKRLHALGRHVTLDEVVRSSARRYEQSGFAKTIFAWVFTIALSYIGIRAVSIEKYIWRVVR